MKFGTTITVDKIVIQAGKPLAITAGVPDNPELLRFINARKGHPMNAEFADVQGDLGLGTDLEDLRLPAGFILEVDLEGEGNGLPADFENAEGITLREKNGYPYLVIEQTQDEKGVFLPIVLDFPALISRIKENQRGLLEKASGLAAASVDPQAKLFDRATGEIVVAEFTSENWDPFADHSELDGELVGFNGELRRVRMTVVGVDDPSTDSGRTVYILDPVDPVPKEPEDQEPGDPEALQKPPAGISAETSARILGMSLEEMLRLHRHAPAGDPMFQGATGVYFAEVMRARRDTAGSEEWTRISKAVG